MIAGAEHSVEEVGFDQVGKTIKVFAKAGPRFLCVDQSDFDSLSDEVIEKG